MKVSIIIPTYNRADLIGQAISSVLEQTFTDWELLVLDDASTDDTKNVVREYIKKDPRIKYIRREKNIGISENRNAGIEKSSGVYIAMLDSDDVWLSKDKLARQVEFLEKNQGYVLVGTNVNCIDLKGTVVGNMTFATDDAHIREHMLLRNQFAQSSVLFLKKAAVEAGSPNIYDANLVVNEDYDLWLRLGMKHHFANIPDYATGYRIHGDSIIRQKKLIAARVHFDIIKKYRQDYPRFALAFCKGYARILYAYFI